MKILIKSAWGSSDPTQASFPFHHANAFAEAGHQVQIFLLGEAVSPDAHGGRERRRAGRLGAALGGAREGHRASRSDPRLRRLLPGPGVLIDDLAGKNAAFSDPPKLVALVEWADKILAE